MGSGLVLLPIHPLIVNRIQDGLAERRGVGAYFGNEAQGLGFAVPGRRLAPRPFVFPDSCNGGKEGEGREGRAGGPPPLPPTSPMIYLARVIKTIQRLAKTEEVFDARGQNHAGGLSPGVLKG